MKSDLEKIWDILTAKERERSLWMMAVVILMAFAEAGGVLSIMPFLSVLARPEIIHSNSTLSWLYTNFDFADAQQFMIALGLASIAMVVASSLFKTVALHSVNRFTYLLRHSISSRLLSNYLGQPYSFFIKHNPSLLSRNILSEVDQLHGGLIKPLSQLVAQGAVAFAMMILLFFYNPWIAASAAILIGFFYAGIYTVVRKRLGSTGKMRQKANGERFQACSEVLAGIKDVKVTQATNIYQNRFNKSSREYSRHQANAETLSQSPLYMIEVAGYTGLIVLSLILIKQSGDIGKVLPVLGLYGFATYRLLPSIQIMYRGFAQLKFSSAALETIHRDFSLQVEIPKEPDHALELKHEIRLQNVHYAYPTISSAKVFENFSLVIKANTVVGITGASGVGKSTLMDILLGLLEVDEGVLTVDNVRVTSSNAGAWQRSIGFVPQHIYLADTSVAENIAFGVDKESINPDALERAARYAQIHDFIINDLDNGYSTMLGERGIRLSGGQRQRIGIARALYHDPSVIFMDEATSALDYRTEKALNEAIKNLAGKKTIVVIAHREQTLSVCKEVINI